MTRHARKKSFALAGVATLMVMILLAFAPAATAQGPLSPVCETQAKASWSDPSVPQIPTLTPFEPESFTFRVNYEYPQGSYSLTPIGITITLSPTDGWVSVTPASVTRTVLANEQDGGSQAVSVQFTVMVDNTAPYRAQAGIDISAVATGGTCLEPPDAYGEQASVQAGFYESWEVRFERMFIPTGQNAQEVIPLTITNSGNGAIFVTPDFHERSSDTLEVILPSTFRVDRATGGESVEATRNIEVNTPFKNGYENRLDSLLLVLRAEPDPRDDSIAMREHTVNAVIRTQGVYVPGFEAVFLLLGALGAAFVAQRRR